MPLSDEERAILEQMEQELRREDPRFASTMSAPPASSSARGERKQRVPRRIAIGVILLVCGQAIMLAGISLPALWMTIVVGIIGFALMLSGLLYALSKQTVTGPVNERSVSPKARGETFMQRQERLWDEHRHH